VNIGVLITTISDSRLYDDDDDRLRMESQSVGVERRLESWRKKWFFRRKQWFSVFICSS
jgi:hypothetical protein